jgi:hypothetical protein
MTLKRENRSTAWETCVFVCACACVRACVRVRVCARARMCFQSNYPGRPCNLDHLYSVSGMHHLTFIVPNKTELQ